MTNSVSIRRILVQPVLAPRVLIHMTVVVLSFVGVFVCSVPAAAKADPAPQWAVDAAKTSTPTSAINASAVILFDEYLITVDDQDHAVEREREAIRILKPQGRGYTHCSIGYDIDEKLNYFRSWTISPDGRQFQAMEADFVDHGAYEAPDTAVNRTHPHSQSAGERPWLGRRLRNRRAPAALYG